MLNGDVIDRLNVRLIAPDRPGMGLSDFQPQRTFPDWPTDVSALADALHLDRFAVLGISGGSPYVAACALAIPHRLDAAAIVSGVAPFDLPNAMEHLEGSRRLIVRLARQASWLARLPFDLTALGMRGNPSRFVAMVESGLSTPDRASFARSEVRQAFADTLRESLRSGTRGVSWDMTLNVLPWGFHLESIAIPVHVWHGEADTINPPALGRCLANAIPHSQTKFYPDEGHFSLIANHLEDILKI
jgi:pimeloyl-ACP methyl ester carboxylesterase